MTLDPNRIQLLVRRRFLLYAGGVLGTWGPVALGFLLACVVADGDEPGTDAPFFVVWYGLALLLVGSFWTARTLPGLSDPNGRQTFLTLPASNDEKWLSSWLVTGPILVAALTLGYWLLCGAVNLTLGALGWPTYLPFDPLSRPVGNLVLGYLAFVHPIFLLGAIAFNRHAHAKTIGIVFAAIFSLVIVTLIAIRIVYADQIDGFFTPRGNVSSDFDDLPEAIGWVLAAVTTVALLAASYFKFQEKQV